MKWDVTDFCYTSTQESLQWRIPNAHIWKKNDVVSTFLKHFYFLFQAWDIFSVWLLRKMDQFPSSVLFGSIIFPRTKQRKDDSLTGSGEPDNERQRGASVIDDEFERLGFGGWEEMIESPFESVEAVRAVVDVDH